MFKRYRIIKNKLGKFIPQEEVGTSNSHWSPLLINERGMVKFDTFEAAETEIKRRQYEVVKTYD